MVLKKRWEVGSDFNWHYHYDTEDHSLNDKLFDDKILLGTGRCALRLIIDWGRKNHNWLRIWVPSYFCPEVTDSILSTGIVTMFYYDDPLSALNLNKVSLITGDVILVNNLFGYRSQPIYNSLPRNNIQIIEDHSHDPWSAWSLNSDADWCFASLRKSLPISDGGILWSPKDHQMPPQPTVTSVHYMASLEKFAGMLLKRNYLQGLPVEKKSFRDLLIKGEQQLGVAPGSGITDFSKAQLFNIPIGDIIKKKNLNREYLTSLIKDSSFYKILNPGENSENCPFSVILYFKTFEVREIFQRSLIQNNIYPAILWPSKQYLVNQDNSSNIDFSKRMLSIHCDFRYSFPDMKRISEILSRTSKEF